MCPNNRITGPSLPRGRVYIHDDRAATSQDIGWFIGTLFDARRLQGHVRLCIFCKYEVDGSLYCIGNMGFVDGIEIGDR